jgi:hypothetical protein
VLNLIVTASATILVAIIVATAIAGALSRRGSSASDNHVRLVRVRDRGAQHAYKVLRKVVRGPGGGSSGGRVIVLRYSDSG